MQRVEYYQIGGFGAHLRDNSAEALAERLLGPSREGAFVLGIRPNGASYLLLPARAFQSHRLGRPYREPWSAMDFESLSPIQFANRRELVAKLKMLESNKKSSDGPRDRSKANTEYSAGGESLSEAGVARALFEHQRVFYLLCQNAIPYPEHYALHMAPWFKDIQLYSFTFNLWASDMRSLEERQSDPRVLDVGWTEFDMPTDSDDLRAVSTTHLVVEENRVLTNRGKTRVILPNVSQTMPQTSIKNLMQELFAPERGGEQKRPKLLLVHDEAMTHTVLRSFGVDSKSRWVRGIKDLLYGPPPDNGYDRAAYDRDHGRYTRVPHDRKSRNRSRSPRRRPVEGGRLRSRSPPPSRLESPSVYVVDVRRMYQYLMQTPTSNETVLSMAKVLNARDTATTRGEDDQVIYEDVNPTHWCAGRESRLVGYMWEEMATKMSIDEQRVLRQGDAMEEPIEPIGGATATIPEEGDIDPNDHIQPITQSAPALRTTVRPVGIYDSEEEDED